LGDRPFDKIGMFVDESGIEIIVNGNIVYRYSDTVDESVNTVRNEEYAWLYDVLKGDFSKYIFDEDASKKIERIYGWLV
jgi:hypothetical protein